MQKLDEISELQERIISAIQNGNSALLGNQPSVKRNKNRDIDLELNGVSELRPSNSNQYYPKSWDTGFENDDDLLFKQPSTKKAKFCQNQDSTNSIYSADTTLFNQTNATKKSSSSSSDRVLRSSLEEIPKLGPQPSGNLQGKTISKNFIRIFFKY